MGMVSWRVHPHRWNITGRKCTGWATSYGWEGCGACSLVSANGLLVTSSVQCALRHLVLQCVAVNDQLAISVRSDYWGGCVWRSLITVQLADVTYVLGVAVAAGY
jgi:hypothetical protein